MLLEYKLLAPKRIIRECSHSEAEQIRIKGTLGYLAVEKHLRGVFVIRKAEENKILLEEIDLSKECFKRIANNKKNSEFYNP